VFLYLAVFVVLPLAAAVPPLLREPPSEIWAKITAPQAMAALKLSASASAVGGLINTLLGSMLAWTLVRYRFPLRRVLDALVDLPFALPGVVAGIALLALYGPASPVGEWIGPDGWFGQALMRVGLPALSLTGGFAALVFANLFVTLPFVVRTVQPVIADLEVDVESAAESLGASPTQVFWRIILPQLSPAIVTGFGLAFARGVNEYGVAVLVSGNIAFESLVLPVYIFQRLEVPDYTGATALAVVLLGMALGVLLLTYGWAQWRVRRVA
jgi:sulfate transport system permease protein